MFLLMNTGKKIVEVRRACGKKSGLLLAESYEYVSWVCGIKNKFGFESSHIIDQFCEN